VNDLLCAAPDAPGAMPERAGSLCAAPDLLCDVRARLTNAIAELPLQDRKILALYFYEGLTFKEVGLVLDISEEAARQRVNEVYGRLHAQIQGGTNQ
jgi:RNA polymerase sigma factor for flagellar operon FliA